MNIKLRKLVKSNIFRMVCKRMREKVQSFGYLTDGKIIIKISLNEQKETRDLDSSLFFCCFWTLTHWAGRVEEEVSTSVCVIAARLEEV